MVRMIHKKILMVCLISFLISSSAFSQGAPSVDVGPETGIVTGVGCPSEGFLINRSNPNTLVAAPFLRNGIFKSTDGGQVWFRSNEGLVDDTGTIPGILKVTGDPSNPQTLYAAGFSGIGNMVFKSTDFGDSWMRIGHVPNNVLTEVAVDPNEADTIYVLTLFTFESSLPGPLFKSTDGGASFTEVGENIPDLDGAQDIAITPMNSNIIYIADAGTFQGLYKSTDRGASFTRLDIAPDFPTCVLPHPADSNVLFLLAGSGTTGLFRSDDGGASFSEITDFFLGDRISSIAFDPSDPSILYAGGLRALYKSIDGGTSFTPIGTGFEDALGQFGILAISVDPRNSRVIYVNTPGGNFKSIDGGTTFTPINNGWKAVTFRGLAFDNQSPANLYATSVNNLGIWRSRDRGKTWEALNNGLEGPAIQTSSIAIPPTNPGLLLVTTADGIFRSADGGQSFIRANVDTGTTDFLVVIGKNIEIDPRNPDNVYAVTFDGFYRSSDGGQNFFQSNAGLTDTDLTTVAVDPKNPNTIYVGTFGSGLFKSTDGGLSFQPTGLTFGLISAIVIDPTNSDTVYVGGAGFDLNRVVKSTDGGNTFAAIDDGLFGENVHSLIIDPENPSNLFVWLGTSGIFRTDDGGGSWDPVDPDGITFKFAQHGRALVLHAGSLFAGGASIFASPEPAREVSAVKVNFGRVMAGSEKDQAVGVYNRGNSTPRFGAILTKWDRIFKVKSPSSIPVSVIPGGNQEVVIRAKPKRIGLFKRLY